MRILAVLLLVGIGLFFCSCGESNGKITNPKTDEQRLANLKIDAEKYTKAFSSLNSNDLFFYTIPRYIKMLGGRTQFRSYIDMAKDTYKQQNITIEKVRLKPYSDVLPLGNRFYVVLTQELVQNFTEGDLQTNLSTFKVIAESADGGENWKFAILSESDVKKLFGQDLADKLSGYLRTE